MSYWRHVFIKERDHIKSKPRVYITRLRLLSKFLKACFYASAYLGEDQQGLVNPTRSSLGYRAEELGIWKSLGVRDHLPGAGTMSHVPPITPQS